jgi:exopolysaccharide biosynthesis WecB/TagA/CpsF family protein
VDAMNADDALETIVRRATSVVEGPPMEVVSVNLDHIHHFGLGGRWRGTLEDAEARGQVEMLYLIDGAPIAKRASALSGVDWPRLAGSDLIGPLLARLQEESVRVGFMGGRSEIQAELARVLPVRYPRLQVVGMWSPTRQQVESEEESARLAVDIAAHDVDVLVVGLGKPRQEIFGYVYGELTGAKVLLAFGAVVDFLADAVPRAPRWMSDHSLEWAYRLAHEPRRLAHRYLVDGPPAYAAMRSKPELRLVPEPETDVCSEALDVAAVVVTHDNEEDIGRLLDDLPAAMGDLSWRVVVKDNGSADRTLDVVRRRPQVIIAPDTSDLGYSRGLNHALATAEEAASYLVLKADVRLQAGSVARLFERVNRPTVGAAVPLVLGAEGRPTPSLRFEPSFLRAVGDAVLGDHFPDRPRWSTEVDHDVASYRHAHPVDWAVGACVLLRRAALESVGPWDEQFLSCSEEVDYLRRVQQTGYTVWFEPGSVVSHRGQAAGRYPDLAAPMAVDRVRYALKHGGPRAAGAMHLVVTLAALSHIGDPAQRHTLATLLRSDSWTQDRQPVASTR